MLINLDYLENSNAGIPPPPEEKRFPARGWMK